jgi:hypothetical protein
METPELEIDKTPIRPGHTRVFRAIGEAEYLDVLNSGQFREGPGTLEGKWFADTLDGALAYAARFYSDGRYWILEAEVPNEAPSLFQEPNLDGHGPARYLDVDDLIGVSPRVRHP